MKQTKFIVIIYLLLLSSNCLSDNTFENNTFNKKKELILKKLNIEHFSLLNFQKCILKSTEWHKHKVCLQKLKENDARIFELEKKYNETL